MERVAVLIDGNNIAHSSRRHGAVVVEKPDAETDLIVVGEEELVVPGAEGLEQWLEILPLVLIPSVAAELTKVFIQKKMKKDQAAQA